MMLFASSGKVHFSGCFGMELHLEIVRRLLENDSYEMVNQIYADMFREHMQLF